MFVLSRPTLWWVLLLAEGLSCAHLPVSLIATMINRVTISIRMDAGRDHTDIELTTAQQGIYRGHDDDDDDVPSSLWDRFRLCGCAHRTESVVEDRRSIMRRESTEDGNYDHP